MGDPLPDLAAAIARQKKLLYWRRYYDENRERILARHKERYQERRAAAAAAADADEPAPKKRGPKPKPREAVVFIGPNGEVRVGGVGDL